jgi:hypothetical protein
MRAFFKKLGDGIVSVSISTVSYVSGVAVSGWNHLVTGWTFTSSYTKTSWSAAKATWNDNHGVRAVMGFCLSLLAIPFVVIGSVFAAAMTWTIGLIVLPLVALGIVAVAIAAFLIAACWFGIVCLFSWLAGCLYTNESSNVETKSESAPQAVPVAA